MHGNHDEECQKNETKAQPSTRRHGHNAMYGSIYRANNHFYRHNSLCRALNLMLKLSRSLEDREKISFLTDNDTIFGREKPVLQDLKGKTEFESKG